jgi:serine protease SohB
MLDAGYQLLLFSAKAIIIVALILILLAGILALFSRGKESMNGRISIKNLTKKYHELAEELMEQVASKKQFKKFLKDRKAADKIKEKEEEKNPSKNVFVLNFNGDIKASAVTGLREEITAVLGIATPNDEVVVCVESGGGMVHAYGLAAAQLQRIRNQQIPLTVIVDKVAASGGYMMACVANKIIAAPFAIIGSIGVVVQLPNFHRLLKEKHVDFEQITAGNFKRTLTMFGHNTDEGREKLQEEIEEIHTHFKAIIQQYRPVDIEKVATGEHWLASQAIELNLVDELMTSDDYLLAKSKQANIFELAYHTKKSFASKLFGSASLFLNKKFYSVF